MSKTAEWLEIMAALRGRKLALLDEISSGMSPATSDHQVQECLCWLIFHRFAWHDGRTYIARPTAEARALWLKDGPAKQDAADAGRRMNLAAETLAQIGAIRISETLAPAQPRGPVHQHQTNFFSGA